MMKRARDLLRADLLSRSDDIAELAREIGVRQRELTTAVDSLRVARDQALRASEVKTSFLSMVSHELRTPLTVLRLQVDKLLRETAKGEAEKLASTIARLDSGCSRLEQLVDSLLDYARIQAGRLEREIERTDVRQIVHEVVEELRPQAEHKQLGLELVASEAAIADTDPRLVRLMVVNLLANALKFTLEGSITLQVETNGGFHRIAVSDTGPGIAPEERSRIFEPQAHAWHRTRSRPRARNGPCSRWTRRADLRARAGQHLRAEAARAIGAELRGLNVGCNGAHRRG
jgi:signal transduction histidine kinase